MQRQTTVAAIHQQQQLAHQSTLFIEARGWRIMSACLTNKALTPQLGRRRRERTVEEVAEPSTSTGARSMPPVVVDAQKDKVAPIIFSQTSRSEWVNKKLKEHLLHCTTQHSTEIETEIFQTIRNHLKHKAS
ncbi:hypothetical protein T11_7036 [Trichinella zimbabwensis]|uniref:Uncharacterized protein n=1 Tax=Trichinella zimbabwensis TaxID=268475 RepID=A0A0V1GTZ8_9BILA|nr:hypothetical protein T11_7036 [Trichinella zimbabwensis]